MIVEQDSRNLSGTPGSAAVNPKTVGIGGNEGSETACHCGFQLIFMKFYILCGNE